MARGGQTRRDPSKCQKGLHDWTEENIFTDSNGISRCKPCQQARRSDPEHVPHPRGSNHCRKGHEYTPENTIKTAKMRNGKKVIERACRRCNRDTQRAGMRRV